MSVLFQYRMSLTARRKVSQATPFASGMPARLMTSLPMTLSPWVLSSHTVQPLPGIFTQPTEWTIGRFSTNFTSSSGGRLSSTFTAGGGFGGGFFGNNFLDITNKRRLRRPFLNLG